VREHRASDDRIGPQQAGGNIHKLKHLRGEPRRRPPGEPKCCEVAVLEGRERRERVERVGQGQRGNLRHDRRWSGGDRRRRDGFGNEGP
jgi:hypothetical protein